MAMTRLERLQSRLDAYYACEDAILDGAQAYAIGTRNLTRADLTEVAGNIKYLEAEIEAERMKEDGHGSIPTFGVIPRDL